MDVIFKSCQKIFVLTEDLNPNEILMDLILFFGIMESFFVFEDASQSDSTNESYF